MSEPDGTAQVLNSAKMIKPVKPLDAKQPHSARAAFTGSRSVLYDDLVLCCGKIYSNLGLKPSAMLSIAKPLPARNLILRKDFEKEHHGRCIYPHQRHLCFFVQAPRRPIWIVKLESKFIQ